MGAVFSSEEEQKILEAVKASCETHKLSLPSMNLTALPEQVLSCPQNYLSSLHSIDLKMNPLSDFTAISLHNFPSLTSLNLSQCFKAATFPQQLTALNSLKILKFCQNHLRTLHINELKHFTALRELNVSGTYL